MCVLFAVGCEFTEYVLNLVGFEARQSSLHGDFAVADKAIDGDDNTHYFDGQTCTHTSAGESMAWWSVNMTKEQSVTKVQLVNRGDCCGESKSLVTYLLAIPMVSCLKI